MATVLSIYQEDTNIYLRDGTQPRKEEVENKRRKAEEINLTEEEEGTMKLIGLSRY